MDRKSLVKLLAEFNSPNWCIRQIDGTDEKIEWLPIWEFEGHRFGVTKKGGWTGEFADRKRIRPDTHAFRGLRQKRDHQWPDADGHGAVGADPCQQCACGPLPASAACAGRLLVWRLGTREDPASLDQRRPDDPVLLRRRTGTEKRDPGR